MSLQAPKPARVAYADVVRVIAILLVVLIHSVSPLFNTLPVNDGGFAVSVLLDGIAHAAVPLFVMVSGIFLLDENRPMSVRRAIRHYALPLVGLYFFWSVLYAAANKVALPLLFENAAVNGEMLKAFGTAVLEGAYHMWYLPMMAGLYLITPILRTFVRQDSRHLVRWFLLIVFVLRFVLPTGIRLTAALIGVDFSAAYNSFELLAGWEYPAYYVAGWYIANTLPEKSVRRKVYAAGVLALAMMLGFTGWMSASRGEAVKELMEQKSLFCGVYAVALFALVAWEGKSLKSNPLLTRLSALSFGVYIIHVEIQQLYKQFIPYTGGSVLLYTLVQWLAVAAVSFIAAWVLSHIPLLKRAVRA